MRGLSLAFYVKTKFLSPNLKLMSANARKCPNRVEKIQMKIEGHKSTPQLRKLMMRERFLKVKKVIVSNLKRAVLCKAAKDKVDQPLEEIKIE